MIACKNCKTVWVGGEAAAQEEQYRHHFPCVTVTSKARWSRIACMVDDKGRDQWVRFETQADYEPFAEAIKPEVDMSASKTWTCWYCNEQVSYETVHYCQALQKAATGHIEQEPDKMPASYERFEHQTTLPADSEARKNVPLYRGLLRYFPAALAGVARVSKLGNDKHNPGEPMHHSRGKSTDHADCILRHLMDLDEDFGKGVGRDENGLPQVDMLAWRALALAQEWHEQNDGAPLAPGAKRPEDKT